MHEENFYTQVRITAYENNLNSVDNIIDDQRKVHHQSIQGMLDYIGETYNLPTDSSKWFIPEGSFGTIAYEEFDGDIIRSYYIVFFCQKHWTPGSAELYQISCNDNLGWEIKTIEGVLN